MSLIFLIILCIIIALLLWVVLYTPPIMEGLKKPKPIRIKLPPAIKKAVPKPAMKAFNNIANKLKKLKGKDILNILPASLKRKLAAIIPAVNRELKREEEAKRKEEERKTRLKLEKESKDRKERAYKTIDKMMELATKYPDTKYEIQSLLTSGLNDFKYGNTIVNSIQTFIDNSMTDKSALETYIKMLRESMSFSQTYQLADMR